MAKKDAPNYKKAENPTKKSCGNCKFWAQTPKNPEHGYCKAFDFYCHAVWICDAWAAGDISESDISAIANEIVVEDLPPEPRKRRGKTGVIGRGAKIKCSDCGRPLDPNKHAIETIYRCQMCAR